jgi:hypothetical protein
MRVMVIVKSTPEQEANPVPSTEMTKMFEEMGRYNEELVKAGVMLAGEGLTPSSQGKRIRFDGKKKTVIDGPFTESKELIAGFWLWQVKSMDEAVEWLKRAPFDGGAEIEIRKVADNEDFGEEFTPELREREDRLRDELAKKGKA